MLLIMIEQFWGISRKDGKYRERMTGFNIRRCKVGALPQIGRSEFYRFAVREIGRGTALLEMTAKPRSGRRKPHNTVPLRRFACSCYRPASFDAGYKYKFILI